MKVIQDQTLKLDCGSHVSCPSEVYVILISSHVFKVIADLTSEASVFLYESQWQSMFVN